MNNVENLKQITLSIQAGTSKDTMELTPMYPKIEFIFGLGSQGMTPFEYELVGKAEGERVLLHLSNENYYRFFEHLNPFLMDLFKGRHDVYIEVTIDAVTPADNRNIVKAMADMAAHSGIGCDCGCGS
jgi:hypothetical protein